MHALWYNNLGQTSLASQLTRDNIMKYKERIKLQTNKNPILK